MAARNGLRDARQNDGGRRHRARRGNAAARRSAEHPVTRMEAATIATLLDRIRSRQARVGVIGLGYVGLPLAVEFARAGFSVTGFDVDAHRSEEHTSELQSQSNLVCRLLLEKQKGYTK